jgi:hypothetical protein
MHHLQKHTLHSQDTHVKLVYEHCLVREMVGGEVQRGGPNLTGKLPGLTLELVQIWGAGSDHLDATNAQIGNMCKEITSRT